MHFTRILVQSSFDALSAAEFASPHTALQFVSAAAACPTPRYLTDASIMANLADFAVDSKDCQYLRIGVLDFVSILVALVNLFNFSWGKIFRLVALGRHTNCKVQARVAENFWNTPVRTSTVHGFVRRPRSSKP